MSSSINSAALKTPQNSLPSPSGRTAKAEMRSEVEPREFYGVLKETARKVYGKQMLAAQQTGKSESNFSTAIDTGMLRAADLVSLGPAYLAELGKELVEHYAPLATPQQRMKQQIKIARQALDELEQGVEQLG